MRKGLSAFPCPCHPKLIKIYIVRSPRFEVQIAGGDDCNSGVAAWECVLFFVLMTLDHMQRSQNAGPSGNPLEMAKYSCS